MGLVASQPVGSSCTRARTHVPCIGRWILNHCATREILTILEITLFVAGFQHQFSDIKLVACNSIQSWYQLPRVRVKLYRFRTTSFTRLPPLQTPVTSFAFSPKHPTSAWSITNSGRASHSLLRFNNSIEWLTELKKVLFLWLSFYYKGYKWTVRWRDT